MKKRVFCILLVVMLLAGMALPAAAAEDRSWEDCYRSLISREVSKYGCVVQLADLNIDGVPELLLGYYPGNGLFSEVDKVFSYCAGEAVEIATDYEYLSSYGYALYRNDSTGEVRVEGEYIYRNGAANHADVYCTYGISSGAFVCGVLFREESYGYSTEYYNGSAAVSQSAYNTAFNGRHDGWTKVDAYGFGEIMKGTGKPSTSEVSELFAAYKSTAKAQPSAHKVSVNGEPVSVSAFNINGNNFFKLRDVAAILNTTGAGFSVAWDAEAKAISLETGGSYTPVSGDLSGLGAVNKIGTPTTAALYVNGESVDLTAYNIDGNNFYKLRDLGTALGFGVGWDAATSTMLITTD